MKCQQIFKWGWGGWGESLEIRKYTKEKNLTGRDSLVVDKPLNKTTMKIKRQKQ